jgi:hydrogenase maturation factor HypF (carbamoyltransferase family)
MVCGCGEGETRIEGHDHKHDQHHDRVHDYRHNLQLYRQLFDFRPNTIVVDKHPPYLSTQQRRPMMADCRLGRSLLP